MNEKKEEAAGGTGCGMKCGCCVCKAVRGLVLLLLGGVIGFWIGRCCSAKGLCGAPAAAKELDAKTRALVMANAEKAFDMLADEEAKKPVKGATARTKAPVSKKAE